jgi:hypothetical protein
MMIRVRRSLLGALAVLALAMPASAQTGGWAALSLVGNRIEIVAAQDSVGSNLDRNERRAFDDAQGTLDRIVLQAVDAAVRRQRSGAAVTMLALGASPLYEQPERLFDGRQLALPGRLVDAIEASKASRLILVTKLRDAVRLPLADQVVGKGTVRGLGFYIDNAIRIQMRNSGDSADGVLAPFVYVRLTLVDVQSGEVVREVLVREMETHATAENPQALRPWDVMSLEQKIERLQRLIEQSVGDGVGSLLQGS